MLLFVCLFSAGHPVVTLGVGQLVHDEIPIFTRCAPHQQDHCVAKLLEVVLLVELFLEHNLAEKVESQGCINEEQDAHEAHDVRDLGQDVQNRVNQKPYRDRSLH